jgi:hypothetical protein
VRERVEHIISGEGSAEKVYEVHLNEMGAEFGVKDATFSLLRIRADQWSDSESLLASWGQIWRVLTYFVL